MTATYVPRKSVWGLFLALFTLVISALLCGVAFADEAGEGAPAAGTEEGSGEGTHDESAGTACACGDDCPALVAARERILVAEERALKAYERVTAAEKAWTEKIEEKGEEWYREIELETVSYKEMSDDLDNSAIALFEKVNDLFKQYGFDMPFSGDDIRQFFDDVVSVMAKYTQDRLEAEDGAAVSEEELTVLAHREDAIRYPFSDEKMKEIVAEVSLISQEDAESMSRELNNWTVLMKDVVGIRMALGELTGYVNFYHKYADEREAAYKEQEEAMKEVEEAYENFLEVQENCDCGCTDEEDPDDPTDPEDPEDSDEPDKPTIPETGDTVPGAALALLSFAGLAGAVVTRRAA